MTLVTLDDSLTLRYRLWRLTPLAPLGETPRPQWLPFSQRERLTPREKTRYRRRTLNLWTTAKSCLNTVMARLSDLLHKNYTAAIAG
ncbi:hypothetical protein [Nostoc sp. CHAB 5715]|uniref:hypothetical protein n=1 Tax=Nostoc sp. CHAB 5715 TaxID=2780400 RepID=UPI001E2EB340|nr:hypothetical protein [Nostoc sp. CHAB 5715]MCC5623305.1 hypothetical protein [Nostoc sp. CHAB 5715]